MTRSGSAEDPPPEQIDELIDAAFGAENRIRLINEYFATMAAPVAKEAWLHVYRMLLWIDTSIGLAHCYESDKCQPGKPWYARSLAFHEWAAAAMASTPSAVADKIDILFRRAASDLASAALFDSGRLAARALAQRQPFEGRGFPSAGDDPELLAILTGALRNHLQPVPSPEQWRRLVRDLRQHISRENKRKNLVGEGFEDVLGSVLTRTLQAGTADIHVRQPLHTIPGFNSPRRGEKINKVDLALLRSSSRHRTIVTAKWSVRADREKQFVSDYQDYKRAMADMQPFDYVLVTNEFDPARLKRACENVVDTKYMFDRVVHISTDAVRATYGQERSRSMLEVLGHISSGRLIDLGSWIQELGRR